MVKKSLISLSPNLGYLPPSKRSYWGFVPEIKMIKAKDFCCKKKPTPTEKRMLKEELAGIEPIEYLFILDNKNKALGRFTQQQVKEMLNDMGFNVSPRFSGSKDSDFAATMNVKGFIFPGWNKLPDLFPQKLEKLLLTKFGPGKERLHIRVYENNDGTWYITAHTDFNWLNINLYKVYKAHLTSGAGNFVVGTKIMKDLFEKFQQHLKNNQILRVEEIIDLVKQNYKSG